MNTISAQFVKGVVGADEIFESNIPQIAFIGRSNVGKSSIINSLVSQPGLARTSSFPGRTQEINIFLVQKTFYFIDLPGYGFAKAPREVQKKLLALIYWYLFDSGYHQRKIVLILDALVGPTETDLEFLRGLSARRKNIVIVANKIDKIKKSQYARHLQKIKAIAGNLTVIPYSSEKKIGIRELRKEIFLTQ